MVKKSIINIVKTILATLFIGIGCLIYIRYPNPVGAFFFSIGLLGVLFLDLNLFTGKIGYLDIKNKYNYYNLGIMLLINLLSAFLFLPFFSDTLMFESKFNQLWWDAIIKGAACGALIYFCVDQYKKGRAWITLIGVPAFILSGGEHCIADMVYLVITRHFDFQSFLFIFLVAIGNSLGSLMISTAQKFITTDENSVLKE